MRARPSLRLRLVPALAASLGLACSLGEGSFSESVLTRAQSQRRTVLGGASVAGVDSAGLDASGALQVCLRLRNGAETEGPLLLRVPLADLGPLAGEPSLDARRHAGFESEGPHDPQGLRFVFFRDALASGCPAPARPVPIVRALPVAASIRAPHLLALLAEPAQLMFQSAEPLWQEQRRLALVPSLSSPREITTRSGNFFYWLAYPFALAADLVSLGFLSVFS